MITRIVMDVDVGDKYRKGMVFDSRFPAGAPVAISQQRLDFFIAKGWAHEQTWDEWAANKLLFKAHFDICDQLTGRKSA